MKSSLVKMGKIEKIFITHLHGQNNPWALCAHNLTVFGHVGDHIGGLLCLLASAMNGDGGTVPGVEDPRAGAVPTKPVYFTKSHT